MSKSAQVSRSREVRSALQNTHKTNKHTAAARSPPRRAHQQEGVNSLLWLSSHVVHKNDVNWRSAPGQHLAAGQAVALGGKIFVGKVAVAAPRLGEAAQLAGQVCATRVAAGARGGSRGG